MKCTAAFIFLVAAMDSGWGQSKSVPATEKERGAPTTVYESGDEVIVSFPGGQARAPVVASPLWNGTAPPPSSANAEAPLQRAGAGPQANLAAAHGVYSVSIDRLIANQQTTDDPTGAEGWGDKVYLMGDVRLLQTSDGIHFTVSPAMQMVRSWTFGDSSNPKWQRVMGGSGRKMGTLGSADRGSPGGIVAGDTLPPIGNCYSLPPQQLCLPMEIWRGRLTQGQLPVLITPTLWEWHAPSPGYDIQAGWLNWSITNSPSIANTQLTEFFNPRVHPYIDATSVGTAQALLFPAQPLAGARPIGIRQFGNGLTQYAPHSIPLTFELAQQVLSGQWSSGGLQKGTFTMRYQDDADTNGRVLLRHYNGDYALTITVHFIGW